MWYFSCPFAKDIDKHVSPWTLQLSFVYRNVCSQWAFYLWPAVSYGFAFPFCLLVGLLSHLQVLRQDIIVPEPAMTLCCCFSWVRFKSNVKCNECEPGQQKQANQKKCEKNNYFSWKKCFARGNRCCRDSKITNQKKSEFKLKTIDMSSSSQETVSYIVSLLCIRYIFFVFFCTWKYLFNILVFNFYLQAFYWTLQVLNLPAKKRKRNKESY